MNSLPRGSFNLPPGCTSHDIDAAAGETESLDERERLELEKADDLHDSIASGDWD